MIIKIIKLVGKYRVGGFINEVKTSSNQKDVFENLKELPGIGNFLAYQIFIDFTYIPVFPFSENEFVVAGPGCEKGLKLIFGDFDGMNYDEALFWLRDNQDKIFSAFDYSPEEIFSDLNEDDRYLNVMSLENCMCEVSKYIRALRGTGRPRVKYKK